jgi:hypothetical protein
MPTNISKKYDIKFNKNPFGGSWGLLAVPSRHAPWATDENHDNASKIAVMSAKIRTAHLQNTSLEPYRYANLLSSLFNLS